VTLHGLTSGHEDHEGTKFTKNNAFAFRVLRDFVSFVSRRRRPWARPSVTVKTVDEGIVASLIEAIEIKRKMFFEFEGAPYVALDVDISRPTARGGQTLVRVKMRNLITRAVFDKTFKAGEKFTEPDLEKVSASYLYADGTGHHFMDQDTYETMTLPEHLVGDDRLLLVDNLIVSIQKYNGNPIGIEFPPIVELTVRDSEPGVRGDTASGGVTKLATLESGLQIRVPLFIKEGEKVKVHTETREFAGRA
jgi:elongation factor P